MTTNTSPKKVSVSTLELSDDIQPRHKIDYDAIGRYRNIIKNSDKGSDALPPITVGLIDHHRHVVIDGYHRVKAHQEAGIRRIKAHIIPCTWEEALWLAAETNLAHGVPLTRKEHRSVFRRYMECGKCLNADGSFKGCRKISVELGGIRGHVTIWKWIKADYPQYTALADDMQGENAGASKGEWGSYEVKHIREYAFGISRVTRDSVRKDGHKQLEPICEEMGRLFRHMSGSFEMDPADFCAMIARETILTDNDIPL